MSIHQYSSDRRLAELEFGANQAQWKRELAIMERRAEMQAILREGQGERQPMRSRLLGWLRLGGRRAADAK